MLVDMIVGGMMVGLPFLVRFLEDGFMYPIRSLAFVGLQQIRIANLSQI